MIWKYEVFYDLLEFGNETCNFFGGVGGGVEVYKHVACRVVESYSYNLQTVKTYIIGTSVTDIRVQTHRPPPPPSLLPSLSQVSVQTVKHNYNTFIGEDEKLYYICHVHLMLHPRFIFIWLLSLYFLVVSDNIGHTFCPRWAGLIRPEFCSSHSIATKESYLLGYDGLPLSL